MLKLSWNKYVLKAAIRGNDGKLQGWKALSILGFLCFELKQTTRSRLPPATHDRAHILVRAPESDTRLPYFIPPLHPRR